MAMQSYLEELEKKPQVEELEKKHQALENEINEYSAHPGADDLVIRDLKRRKLLLKDEIERLRQTGQVNLH